MSKLRDITFILNWIILGLISSIDTYLAIRYIQSPLDEYNPLGRLLLHLGGMPLFMAFRMFGLALGLGIVALAYIKNPKVGYLSLLFTVLIYLAALVWMLW